VCEACVVGGRFIGFGRYRTVGSGSGGAGPLASQSGPRGSNAVVAEHDVRDLEPRGDGLGEVDPACSRRDRGGIDGNMMGLRAPCMACGPSRRSAVGSTWHLMRGGRTCQSVRRPAGCRLRAWPRGWARATLEFGLLRPPPLRRICRQCTRLPWRI
jgi:hypothetical protein